MQIFLSRIEVAGSEIPLSRRRQSLKFHLPCVRAFQNLLLLLLALDSMEHSVEYSNELTL